ncbi:hypothetical protein ACWKSP_22255 [Micromonosporaceae bacterium Da 78-11]
MSKQILRLGQWVRWLTPSSYDDDLQEWKQLTALEPSDFADCLIFRFHDGYSCRLHVDNLVAVDVFGERFWEVSDAKPEDAK